jgi:hypothetical protein
MAYFTVIQYPDWVASDHRVIGKNLEGMGCGPVEVLYRYVLARTENLHEEPRSG